MNIVIAFLMAGVFCTLAYFKKWLDAGGAITATITGTIVWIAGGWQLALPLLFFFITGSLLAMLQPKAGISDEKSKRPRDYIQVLANGSIAIGCLLFYTWYKNPVFITAYFLSIAISMSDTCASGVGIWLGGKVLDIRNGKPLAKGLSGGISVAGTVAGFVGSLLIALLYYFFFSKEYTSAAIICVGGFAGMLADSFLGSFFQARYILSNGQKAEFTGTDDDGKLEKGFAWMTNDVVNLLSNLLTTLTALELLLIK